MGAIFSLCEHAADGHRNAAPAADALTSALARRWGKALLRAIWLEDLNACQRVLVQLQIKLSTENAQREALHTKDDKYGATPLHWAVWHGTGLSDGSCDMTTLVLKLLDVQTKLTRALRFAS